jgi:TolA-binding protein
MPGESTTELLIRARNLTREAFAAAERDLKSLGKQSDDTGDKFRGLGKDAEGSFKGMASEAKALAGALGIAFSVQGVVAFGAELLRMGDEITRVADRTGLTADEVQRLQFVADQSGNTIEDLTSAIGQMQNRLASGDESAVGALKQLGLSFEDLARMDPYEQMRAIAEAIGKIPNPANQAQVAMDLFGKAGIGILPTLKADFDGLANAAPVMSAATVKALDDAGDALNKFKTTAKVWAAEAYNYLGGLFDRGVAAIYNYVGGLHESLAGIMGAFAKIPGAAKVWPGLEADIKGVVESARWYHDAADGMTRKTDSVAEAAKKAIAPMLAVGKATKEHGDHQRATTQAQADSLVVTSQQQQVLDLLAKAHEHEVANLKLEESAWRSWESTVSKALQNIAKNPSLPLLQGRDLSGAVPQVSAAAASNPGNLAGVNTHGSAPSFLQSIFGSSEQFGAQLSGVIMGAIQGGGKPIAAAGALIGSGLMGGLANTITSGGGLAISGALGGALNSILPGVGALIGPLAEKLVSAIAGAFDRNKGRDVVQSFVQDTFGGYDALHAKLNELGAAGEQLWIRLTQGVGRNNPAQARAAIDEVTSALAAHQQKVQEDAAAVEQASQRASEAHQAVVDQAKSQLQALDDEIKSLQDSIASEKTEDVMGVVEAQARARLAALQEERDAAAAHVEDVQNQLTDSMDRVAEAIAGIPRDLEIRVRAIYEDGGVAGGRGAGVPSHDVGAYIRRDHLANVHAGEIIGPADFMTRALQDALRVVGGSTGPSGLPPIILQVDGREIARANARYQGEVVGAYGAGR